MQLVWHQWDSGTTSGQAETSRVSDTVTVTPVMSIPMSSQGSGVSPGSFLLGDDSFLLWNFSQSLHVTREEKAQQDLCLEWRLWAAWWSASWAVNPSYALLGATESRHHPRKGDRRAQKRSQDLWIIVPDPPLTSLPFSGTSCTMCKVRYELMTGEAPSLFCRSGGRIPEHTYPGLGLEASEFLRKAWSYAAPVICPESKGQCLRQWGKTSWHLYHRAIFVTVLPPGSLRN